MPYLGAHLSIAGGIPKAVERAEAAGCEALQIFTKSVGQWKARVLDDARSRSSATRSSRSRLRAVVAHASYLSNIASPNPALREQSLAALGEEIDRVGTPRPARPRHASRARPTEAEGLPRIADGLHAAARGAPTRPDDDAPRAHGRPGQQPRATASSISPRSSRWCPMRVPRAGSASAWTPVI